MLRKFYGILSIVLDIQMYSYVFVDQQILLVFSDLKIVTETLL